MATKKTEKSGSAKLLTQHDRMARGDMKSVNDPKAVGLKSGGKAKKGCK
jgi:hypothetical protein